MTFTFTIVAVDRIEGEVTVRVGVVPDSAALRHTAPEGIHGTVVIAMTPEEVAQYTVLEQGIADRVYAAMLGGDAQ